MTPELKNQLNVLPSNTGVYRFIDNAGKVIYVGKARSLHNRVSSYFRSAGRGLSPRIQSLVHQIASIEVTVTHTESEALLLENNLIKSLYPRYNILLRDDKSYPYIFVSEADDFPRLAFHRGAQREKGRYFGPYPSASAVRDSLNLLQKLFPVRQCEDSFFRNRSRPCLQYQIKRCTAPCVGLVDQAQYAQDVRHAALFLDGKSRTVIEEMVKKMEQAVARENYEDAALYRDRIAALKRIQERQYITGKAVDADVLAAAIMDESVCVEVMFLRGGMNLGSKGFFPKAGPGSTLEEALAAFLPQYYLNAAGTPNKPIPKRIYVNKAIPGKSLLEQAFAQQANHKVNILTSANVRGAPRRWLKMAEKNAVEALQREIRSRISLSERFEALRLALALDAVPERIECFDISHTQGEATVAACVVFDRNGSVKSSYRRFNIEGVQPSDDYGALAQALRRRYRPVQEGEGRLPDLLMVDGGKGQVSTAAAVLSELQIGGLRLVGVSKGHKRRPGNEMLFLSPSDEPIILPADSPALHLIQNVRDEAHRFAITGHRQRRGRARTTSLLETISGIGDKRRQALLKNLGGLREVARAGVEDLARIPGISPTLAQRIYDAFHEQGP